MKPAMRGGNNSAGSQKPLVEIEIDMGGGEEAEAPESPEMAEPVGYKKGGRIDGCAIRGKTKGTVR